MSDDEVGWHYQKRSRDNPRIHYAFANPDSRLVGRCGNGPEFILTGGDYPDRAEYFYLQVDGRSWQLPITIHAHGRFLRVDQREMVAAMVQANERIDFAVGKWNRSMPPSPLLKQFQADCL